MLSTMRLVVLVTTCLACAGHTRRVQSRKFDEQVKHVAEQMRGKDVPDMKALATTLLASVPRSAFALSGAGTQTATPHRSAGSVKMSTNPDAPIKLGVNGFGRIGRQVVRIAMNRDEFVLKHINSPMSPEYMKYLLEHDTVHGRFDGTVEIKNDGLYINGLGVSLSATRDPTEIPWRSAGVQYVCESTGAFTTTEGCLKHMESGAKKVIISAPAKDADTPTIVVGVNTDDYNPSMQVVSCASCTTNGLAPLVKVINEKFGIKQGLMTTVHAATASQLTVDGSMKGKDWRAGRAASANIIPSSTGAAKAVAKAYPVMKGKLTGMAFRVPTVDVSVVDLTCELEKETTYEDIKAEVKLASETYAKGVVGYTEDQVVSSDFIGETCSTVFDAEAGIMLTPTFVKLVSWYDNEWGYSTRLVDLVALMAAADSKAGSDEKVPAYITARAVEDTREESAVEKVPEAVPVEKVVEEVPKEVAVEEVVEEAPKEAVIVKVEEEGMDMNELMDLYGKEFDPQTYSAIADDELSTRIKASIAKALGVAVSKVTDDTRFVEDLGVQQEEIDEDESYNTDMEKIMFATEEDLLIELVPTRYWRVKTVADYIEATKEGLDILVGTDERLSPWYEDDEGPPMFML